MGKQVGVRSTGGHPGRIKMRVAVELESGGRF